MLWRVRDERTPRFFKDGDGRFLLTLDAAPDQPQGTRIRLGSEQVSDTYLQLAHVWLPASRYIVRTGLNDTQILRLELNGHTLLDAP